MATKDAPDQNDFAADDGLAPGDRVLDLAHLQKYPASFCGQETPTIGVVLDALDLRADELEIAEGYTVADDNRGFPGDDPVIQVAFEDELDDRVDGWREWDIRPVQAAVIKRGETPPPWHFPASRLVPVSEAVARSAWNGAVDAALDGGGSQ